MKDGQKQEKGHRTEKVEAISSRVTAKSMKYSGQMESIL